MWRYYGLRFCELTLSRLPLWLGRALATLAGTLGFLFAGKSRATIEGNLARVLGRHVHLKARRRVARGSFCNLAQYYYDVVRLRRCSPKRINDRIEFVGLEHLREAQARGKGVILATAHLGSFELVSQAAVAHGLSMTILVEHLQPEKLWRYWMSLRNAKGLSFEPADAGGIRATFKTLRKGGLVAIAGDRAVHGGGVVTDFMGEPALMPTGAIELALRTGAALMPAFSLRTGKDRYQVFFEPPLPLLAGTRYTQEDVRRLLDRFIAVMERYIRKAPEQWMVFQPIWTARTGRPEAQGSHQEPVATVSRGPHP